MRVAPYSIIVIYLFLAATAPAVIPKKQPNIRYKELWENSPFTSKPLPEKDVTPPENPLDDYTLASICKVDNGWHVVLLHKKDRTQRVRLTPAGSTEKDYKVISVEEPGSRQARVEIDASGQKGWVTFEQKFLALKKPTMNVAGARTKGQPPRSKHNQGQPPIPGYKPSKVRKVPSPPSK